MSASDFAVHAVAVATSFWGEPNKSLSTSKKVCWGSNGGKSVSVEKGTWFDYEADVGGGVLKLVEHELGCDKSTALKWLTDQGFLEANEGAPERPQERREAAPTPERQPEREMPPDEPKGDMVAVKGYDYTDADGNPLYQVVRYQWKLPDGSWAIDDKTGNPKKTFRQRRKDSAGNIVWNLDGIGHTIFRHPLVEIGIAEGKPIVLVEGEKDVETIEGWGLVASTNSGGAKHWSADHAELLRGADVIIIVDNDDAGRAGGEIRAKSLRGIARRIRLLDLSQWVNNFPAKHDVTDWRDHMGGTVDQLKAIIDRLPDWKPAPPVSKFGAVGLHELGRKDLQHDFLIDGFLDRRGVAMMPGASGSGKTFITLEIGMCVALGRKFWDMPVKPGLVVYQAGEGAPGAAKRMEGWMLDRGVDDPASVPFRMLPQKINLFADDKDTDDLIAECQAWAEHFDVPMRLLVIDTFNKAITGANENAGQDMSRVLSRAERISDTLNCAVLIPLHKSKAGEMRGHTSLTGDVSNVLNVSELQIRDNNRRIIRTVSLDKNKDGEKGSPLRFVLRQVVLPDDQTGKPRTTCVVDRPDGNDDELALQGKLSLDQVMVLRILKETIDRDGVEAPADLRGVPSGRRVVEQRKWQESVRREWFFKSPDSEPEKRAKELRDLIARTAKALKSAGYIDRDEIGPEDGRKAYVWWTGKSDQPAHRAREPDAPPINEELRRELATMDTPF
ncbi:AAA family ATPase [Devosia algicola]|uniref:AAA family ATPase n=1 Tax=Devosia algicola TaxID=3026418 RepID=A0ABY7YRE9_9HYPH|nr:AAA family ATPase [Devosia algicola]WDR03640.1 AAA family ATPase [Devosia algicola]